MAERGGDSMKQRVFDGMEYVYAVYREGSFQKAAEKLFVSQPSVSASVRWEPPVRPQPEAARAHRVRRGVHRLHGEDLRHGAGLYGVCERLGGASPRKARGRGEQPFFLAAAAADDGVVPGALPRHHAHTGGGDNAPARGNAAAGNGRSRGGLYDPEHGAL